jgi:hypothetical protein
MINTESGVKVQARDGDVVMFPLAIHIGTLAHKLNNGGWEFDDRSFTGSLEGYVLLHRPFQVGDEAQEYLGICGEYNDESFIITQQKTADLANSGKIDLRHSDPALRDHSQWGKV